MGAASARGWGNLAEPSHETEVAVLFADVVGSTRLYEVLGDLKARDMVVSCVDLMRAATERNRGSVIKTIGDEILAIFPTANDAVNAAGEMQQDIRARPSLEVQGQHVAIRIGCHFGPVVLENRDVFGSSVHTANRMTSQAKAGQIILTADTVRRLSPEWRAVTRQIDVTPVKGRAEEIELFEVLWQQEDATSGNPLRSTTRRTPSRRCLRSSMRSPGCCNHGACSPRRSWVTAWANLWPPASRACSACRMECG